MQQKEDYPPITGGPDFTIDDMYRVSRGLNAVWALEGYEAPKKYADPNRQIKDRELEEAIKKGMKNKLYITKRGNYLDDYRKASIAPGPGTYNTVIKWPDAKSKDAKKLHITAKNSYIDLIYKEQKLRSTPGPGAYNLLKTKEQMKSEAEDNKKKITTSKAEKDNYLNEYEHMGNLYPGPGSYNPHPFINKIHKNSKTPKDWIDYHKDKGKKESTKSASNTSYNPIPTMYKTFDSIALAAKDKTKETKAKMWGTSERFPDPKKSKVKVTEIPGPGAHNLIAKWPGKDFKKNKDAKGEKDWMKGITKGVYTSIYYS